jgi:two-component system, OmpR family, response regulator
MPRAARRPPARRVLLIEDDGALAGLLTHALTRTGCDVDHADSGRVGARAWKTGAYDLVVLDLTLPDRDGLDLLRERRGAGDTTPVIVGSNRARWEYAREVRSLGVAACYVKAETGLGDVVALVDQLLPPARRRP